MATITFHASTSANAMALIFAAVFVVCAALAVQHGVWVAVVIFAALTGWITMFVFTTRIDVSDNAVSFSRYFLRRFIVTLGGARISETRIGDLKLEPAILVSNERVAGAIPLGLLAAKDAIRLRALIEKRAAH
jgi:hypothetical protein